MFPSYTNLVQQNDFRLWGRERFLVVPVNVSMYLGICHDLHRTLKAFDVARSWSTRVSAQLKSEYVLELELWRFGHVWAWQESRVTNKLFVCRSNRCRDFPLGQDVILNRMLRRNLKIMGVRSMEICVTPNPWKTRKWRGSEVMFLKAACVKLDLTTNLSSRLNSRIVVLRDEIATKREMLGIRDQ